jgi:CheY-like chemotaxis protein/HPt (histidine-containing phosphotransfer) domain-containing protein
MRILVAEDVPAVQTLLVRILSKSGHSAKLAQDGNEAVQLARTQPFDLVLMDIQMPCLDGLQATAAIRELPRKIPVPIVGISARRIPGDRERCLAAGIDVFLPKPINGPRLIQLIEELTAATSASPNGLSSEHEQTSESQDAESSELVANAAVFDFHGALKRLGGDLTLLADLVKMFIVDSPLLLNRLVAGVEAQRRGQIQHAAHSLRGLASIFGSTVLTGPLDELERRANLGQTTDLFPLVEKVRREKVRLEEALEPYC